MNKEFRERHQFKKKPTKGKTFRSIHYLYQFAEDRGVPEIATIMDKAVAVLAQRGEINEHSGSFWFHLHSTAMLFNYNRSTDIRYAKCVSLNELDLDYEEIGKLFSLYNDFATAMVAQIRAEHTDSKIEPHEFFVKVDDGALLEIKSLVML